MERKRVFLFAFISMAVLLIAGYFIFDNLKKNSGLRVETYPKSKVYIDSKEAGETPFYKEGMASGEYLVKLVPSSGNITPYETKVKLNSQSLTVLTRVFNAREDYVSGELISLEKRAVDQPSMSIVTDPDSVLVRVDGEEKGQSPLYLKDISVGTHEIVVSKPGYDSQIVNGNTVSGYELRIVVKLPKSIELGGVVASPSTQPQSQLSQNKQNMIEILSTPTGFLRMRSGPSVTSSESARLLPGMKYELLEETDGWGKINIGTVSGWISSDYFRKL